MQNRNNHKHDCPVCLGARGKDKDCHSVKQHNGVDLFYCRAKNIPALGFVQIGEGTHGFPRFIRSEDYKGGKKHQTDSVDDLLYRQRREKEQQEKFDGRMSIPECDKSYRELFNQLTLEEPERQEIIRRGYNPDDFIGVFRTLKEGINLENPIDPRTPGLTDGRYINVFEPKKDSKRPFFEGLVIATFNEDGLMTHPQVRPRKVTTSFKYGWTKTNDIISCHLKEYNALPLTVARGGSETHLSEGTGKPQFSKVRHGHTYIGSSGGDFAGSRQLIKILEKIHPDKSKPVFYDVDIDSLTNEQTFNKIVKTAIWLGLHGYTMLIGDWGQLDKKKGHPLAVEIDEIPTGTAINYISIDEFKSRREAILRREEEEKLNSQIQKTEAEITQEDQSPQETIKDNFLTNVVRGGRRALQKLLPKREIKGTSKNEKWGSYIPGELPSAAESNQRCIEFKQGQRERLYQEASRAGHSIILDVSGTGTGKTYSLGNLTPSPFFSLKDDDQSEEEKLRRIFYLSQSPRNPNTIELEEKFEELPSRTATGYKKNFDKYTPSGKPHREALRSGEEALEVTDANCREAEKFILYRDKGIPTEGLCAACPAYEKCKLGIGEKSGYLGQAREALKSQYVRAHVMALGDEMINSRDIGIVDEYVSAITPTHHVSVSVKDINDTLVLLEKNTPQLMGELEIPLSRLSRMLSNVNEIPAFGYDHLKISDKIGKPPANTLAMISLLEQFRKPLDKETNQKPIQELRQQLTKFWITNFLRVWGNEYFTDGNGEVIPQGCLWANGDQLQIVTRNSRVLDTLKRFHCTVFQDATGTATELSLWLGVSPDEILVVRQELGDHSNLTIKHVVGLGKAGKDRSEDCQKRINALVEQLKKNHGDKNIGFIDFKSKAQEGWLTHFVDGRGSNAYQEKDAVAAFGAAYQSLSGLQNLYQSFTGDYFSIEEGIKEDGTFQKYFNDRLQAEILQEIGRLRHNRRNAPVTFYLCCDLDVSWLRDLGYAVEEVHAGSITPEAASRGERTDYALASAFKSLTVGLGKTVEEALQTTLTEVAALANRKIANASQSIKAVFGGWKEFKQFLVSLIYKEEGKLENLNQEQLTVMDYLKSMLGLNDDEILDEVRTCFESWGLEDSISYFGLLDGQSKINLLNRILTITARQWIPILNE